MIIYGIMIRGNKNKNVENLKPNQIEEAKEALTFNEGVLLKEIAKTMAASPGYSLIRYEAKGTRDLDSEKRKMTIEELKTYFGNAKRDGVLIDIFDEGLKQVKNRNEALTITNIVRYGLTWWEYYNYRSRMSAVKQAERKVLRKTILVKKEKPRTTQSNASREQKIESGIPYREDPKPYHPGQAVGEKPFERP